ncbi:melanocyte-stimulating hormone receptor-like [Oculina patagonica]
MNNTDKHSNESADHHSGNEDYSSPGTIIIINCVLNAPLMLISILGNALVLAAIIRTPTIRSTSLLMLCSLAVSDLLVGLIAQPIYIAVQITQDRFVQLVFRMIGPYLCGVSLLTITAITVDRFLALHYHMRYATLVTKSRVKYTLVIIWLITLLQSSFHFWSPHVDSFLLGVGTVICLIISLFSYIRIYLIVRRHQSQIHAQQQAGQNSNTENNLNITRLKKSAISTFMFYIALMICYFPMYVSLTLHGISKKIWQPEWELAITLVLSNSSINPFLYCWRLRELRTAVVKTARQMLRKQTE